MTSLSTLEAGCVVLSETAAEVLVLRQEVQNFVELSVRILDNRRTGPSTLM